MAKEQKQKTQQKRRINTVLVVGVIILLGVASFLLVQSFIGLDSLSNPIADGDIAPPFTLASLTGETVTVPDTTRQATVIFSMAYWCGTCIPEARALAQLQDEYSDVLRVVLVDMDPSSSPQNLQQFIQAVGPNDLTWTFDSDGEFSRTYGIRVLDTTIILNENGRETYRDAYPTSYDTLRTELARIIDL